MKTTLLPILLFACLLAACSSSSTEEDTEASGDAVSNRALMMPVRKLLFAADVDNDIALACTAGTGIHQVTVTIAHGKDAALQASAAYQKSAFRGGYVGAHVALGAATETANGYTFDIAGKRAELETSGTPVLVVDGKSTTLACKAYEAPYAVEQVFG